jgi:hypothetical protein
MCALLCALGACGPDRSPARDAGANEQDAESGIPEPVYVSCSQMDVLFVIDNSPSMKQEQQNLSDNFDGFVESLRQFQGGTVDFRIGVTTTAFPMSFSELVVQTPAASGTLLKTADMNEPWLSSSDPDLSARFRALATVGTNGAWDEQPLKAMRAALIDRTADEQTAQNAGFVRPNALLALVVLTDEDDLSNDSDGFNGGGPIPVGSFITEFDALKGARGYWSAAVFAGGTAPTCNSSFGSALFAARLQAFVEQAGANAVFHSICEGDLKAGFDAALATFANACEFLLF